MACVVLTNRFAQFKRLGYINAFDFCKQKREHLLCVKIVEYKKGIIKKSDFESLVASLIALCNSCGLNFYLDRGEYDSGTTLAR